MANKIVKRGYVVVYRNKLTSAIAVTAVLGSWGEATRLRGKVGGTIVDVQGQPYRIAQGTLRVLVNKSDAITLAGIAERI